MVGLAQEPSGEGIKARTAARSQGNGAARTGRAAAGAAPARGDGRQQGNNQKLKSMQAVDEMKYLMRDLQTNELNLADSKDAEAQQKNIKNIESINSRFHDLMDGYTEKGVEGVPERVDAANKAWGDLYQTGKQIESLVEEGKNDETRAQRACGNW